MKTTPAVRPLEIVGGGLAGLSLGLALRNAGIPVTVLEAGDYPRHRVCGEFITGLGPATIDRLGLAPLLADALSHREVAWFTGEGPPVIQHLPAPARGISRHRLDARLAAAFVAAGGELRTRTRVTDPLPVPGRIFATGRRRAPSAWLGLKIHARNLRLTRDLELHLGGQVYVGLSRVENGRVNVCGLFRRRKLPGPDAGILPAYLRASGLTTLADRLAAAEIDDESFCSVAAVSFDRRVPPADRVCLGDAWAMIPPFTGNGMAMAWQSAETALGPLLTYARGRNSWPETCHVVHTRLRHRFRLRLASAGALHPFLLRPSGQRWLMALSRARLLPLRPLYTLLH
jgi:2-polyprenyl-6-methoxyphenol hydroxylase-like FAD-dependent oxidoreductase